MKEFKGTMDEVVDCDVKGINFDKIEQLIKKVKDNG
jgi:hypothetical protein